MVRQVIRIERTNPRAGVIEEPLLTGKGYQLADPANGRLKHHAEMATHVRTLDEVATLIDKGFSLWMTAKGKRPSLITPPKLRVVRVESALGAQSVI